MKPILAAIAVLAAVGFVLSSSPARADDDPALPDGGSIVTSTDGGRCAVVDLGQHSFTMGLTCEGDQSARYKLCAALPCAPTAINQPIIHDRTMDIPVNQTPGWPSKRYLGVCTDDAGIPYCNAQIFH